MLTTDAIAASFVPGTHASTFGGNPVAAAAAVATLKIMLADGFLPGVTGQGKIFSKIDCTAWSSVFPIFSPGCGAWA